MEREDLKKQVTELVDGLFSEKEESEIRKQTQAELEKAASTISDLTVALEDKNTEFSNVEEKLSESEAKISELESELEAARKESETATEKLGEVEKALEDIKKDRAAEVRLAELEDAGVTHSGKETQLAKVREMSDEDFASYRDELISIRKTVLAELEASKAEENAKAEEEAKKAEEAKKVEEANKTEETEESEEANKTEETKESEEANEAEEETSEEEETTTPAKITLGQAAMASLNMEYIPSDSLVAKYAKLGEAMAKRFKRS